ncbi:MAG TPA: hypothetical protein VLL08_33150 [Kineosporiaceae bacterium]|nr:hypothetical protein [Kineosporiaceae bacterium]
MITNSDAGPAVERRHRPRLGAVAVFGGLTFLIVVLLTLLDRAQVQTQQELEHVAFGMPLNWVTQTQSLDPPLPYSTEFLSPWENPSHIDLLPLALNMIILGLVLAGIWSAVASMRSRPSTT